MIMNIIFFSWLANNPSKLTEEMFNIFKESFDISGKSVRMASLDGNEEKTDGNV